MPVFTLQIQVAVAPRKPHDLTLLVALPENFEEILCYEYFLFRESLEN